MEVKSNKVQSRMLSDRVNGLVEQLQRMDVFRVLGQCVEELRCCLEAALDLISTHDKQSHLFNVFRSGTYAERFREIHERLTRVQQDLGIKAVADIGALQTQLRLAAEADQRAFDQLSRAVRENHDDLALKMLGMQERVEKLVVMFEAVQAAAPGSPTPPPRHGADSGCPSASVASLFPSTLSPSAGSTTATAHAAPWRISHDALVFELDKKGRGYRVSLGKGAFGEVFKAKLGNQAAAVKEFAHEILRNAVHAAAFLQEVELLHRLHHPNLVKLYGAV
jgi:hypothetical protein